MRNAETFAETFAERILSYLEKKLFGDVSHKITKSKKIYFSFTPLVN